MSEEEGGGGMDLNGLYLSDTERARLCKLREEILQERRAANRGYDGELTVVSPSRRLREKAHILSKGEYSYGNVPFTNAQCLPCRTGGYNTSADLSADFDKDGSSEMLGNFDKTLSEVSPRDLPKALPVSGNMRSANSLQSKKNK